ncbi:MAG: GDP-mannose 4,6-dehydratase, partial [Acidobacteriota bacterium]
MNKKHYLVTGGAGFIGSHLVDRLLAAGGQVSVIDNFDPFYAASVKLQNISAHLENPDYRLYEVDLRNYRSLETIIAAQQIDAIIHLAAKAG